MERVGARRKATQMRKLVLERKNAEARKRGVICALEGSLLRMLVQIPENACSGPGSSYTHRLVAGALWLQSVSQSVSQVGLMLLGFQSKGHH